MSNTDEIQVAGIGAFTALLTGNPPGASEYLERLGANELAYLDAMLGELKIYVVDAYNKAAS